jgi:alcohol dehydrogenase class IV
MSEMSAGRWSYYNPVRITAGAGCFADIAQALPAAGAILLVTTPGFTRRGLTARLAELLGDRLQVCDVVTPNPELDDVDALTDRFQDEGICSIVALGGGSVIDTAKVLSVTLPCAESTSAGERPPSGLCTRLAGTPASRRSSYHLRYRGGSDPFCNHLGPIDSQQVFGHR